jgi:hypothetical protein
MTQDGYGNIHGFGITQLSVHVYDLRQRRDAEAGGAFDRANNNWLSELTFPAKLALGTLYSASSILRSGKGDMQSERLQWADEEE